MNNYVNIARNFSNSFNVEKELFSIDYSNDNVIREYCDYEEFEIHSLKNDFFYGYQFKQNKKENWQCVSFHIKAKSNFEVLNILSEELSKIDSNIINIDDALDQLKFDSEFEFHYYEGDNLLINGIISDYESYISISRPILTTKEKVTSMVFNNELVA